MPKRLSERIIIQESQVPIWMGGKNWQELEWQMAPNPRRVIIARYGDGWAHCLVHGYEKIFISKDLIVSRSLPRGYTCQLFMIIRSREAFVADPIDLSDPRIYEREFSIREGDDIMPHVQRVAVDFTGRGRGDRRN